MANIDTSAFNEGKVGGPQLSPVRVFRHTLSAEPSVNDHLRFFKIPKNCKVAFAMVGCTDIDTNGTPLVDFNLILSDGTTDKILIDGMTIGRTGGVALPSAAADEPGWGFVTTNDDFYIAIDWQAAAATFAAGTITVTVIYTTVLDAGS